MANKVVRLIDLTNDELDLLLFIDEDDCISNKCLHDDKFILTRENVKCIEENIDKWFCINIKKALRKLTRKLYDEL